MGKIYSKSKACIENRTQNNRKPGSQNFFILKWELWYCCLWTNLSSEWGCFNFPQWQWIIYVCFVYIINQMSFISFVTYTVLNAYKKKRFYFFILAQCTYIPKDNHEKFIFFLINYNTCKFFVHVFNLWTCLDNSITDC